MTEHCALHNVASKNGVNSANIGGIGVSHVLCS